LENIRTVGVTLTILKGIIIKNIYNQQIIINLIFISEKIADRLLIYRIKDNIKYLSDYLLIKTTFYITVPDI